MSDEKTKILTMLSEGKISVADAEKLLAAVSEPQEATSTPKSEVKKSPKFLRVQVNSDEESVNVKVPIQILKSGVRLASVLPAQAQGTIQTSMNGIDISKIGPENVDEFIENLADFSIDVEGQESVRIYCE